MPLLTATMTTSTNDKAPSPKGDHLLTLDQLPEWARNNPYILTGYRPISYSYRVCLASWSYVHNETMNTYSHLLLVFPTASLLLRAGLVLTGKVESLTAPGIEDILVFSVFLLGALTCMGFSAAYHTLMSHSQKVADTTKQFDYMGITCLIYGSFVPTIYYTFTFHRYVGRIARFLCIAARKPSVDCSAPRADVCDLCRIRSGAVG
ncbi:MAG: hypothetical protein Q9208_006809 [Pyrenodesmia sp. 3 TL-2023]